MKSFLAVIGALSLILFVGSNFVERSSRSDASSEVASPSSVKTVTSEDAEISVPTAQRHLIDTIEYFRVQYERAPNEFQKSAVRRERSSAIQTLLANCSVRGWVGILDSMTTTGEGNGTLSVRLAGSNRIKVKTWNNQLSDFGSDTVISPTSPVYNQVASMASGQKVTFSGTFLRGRQDYLEESSITEEGSMTDPEFIFSFARIDSGFSAEQPNPALSAQDGRPSPEPTQPARGNGQSDWNGIEPVNDNADDIRVGDQCTDCSTKRGASERHFRICASERTTQLKLSIRCSLKGLN